jgi:hypothetical protein
MPSLLKGNPGGRYRWRNLDSGQQINVMEIIRSPAISFHYRKYNNKQAQGVGRKAEG